MIERVTGKPVPYDNAPRRDGDLTRLYANPQRAQDVLGFTAQHSNLKNIIQTAWNFHSRVWNIK